MRQLALDIRPPTPPSFDNFIVGANGEAVARLKALARPDGFEAVCVWGEAGAGRSHLLLAVQQLALSMGRTVVFRQGVAVDDGLPLPAGALVIIDDVETTSPEGQIALFRAFNSARVAGLALLVAGNVPPQQLPLREDLRTRIGQSLIYRLHALSDEEKAEFLRRHAAERGLQLEAEHIAYLLRHGRRDPHSLMMVLDAADEISLVQKRAITLPMLREIVQAMNEGCA